MKRGAAQLATSAARSAAWRCAWQAGAAPTIGAAQTAACQAHWHRCTQVRSVSSSAAAPPPSSALETVGVTTGVDNG
eukprot:scaffold44995_cov57-Phaeocystis_antarctica.AAC.2